MGTAGFDENQLQALVDRLTLAQKVRLLTGTDFWHLPAEPAIGLRSILLSDGPVGVRGPHWDERYPSACLPSPTALAATWADDLVEELGGLLAAEARAKGVDVLLAPTINLHRSPLAGRHFECFSEDPLLTGRIGAAYVRGLQRHGVAATAKHYVCNDSETERMTVDVAVDERTLRELYLAPFADLVAAGVWLVMAAYNGVHGATMTENPLLRSPLQDEWRFDGVVVSDWTAARTVASATAALDLVMPGPGGPWGEALVDAVREGLVPEAAVDEKVTRLLRLATRVGALDGVAAPVAPRWSPAATSALLRKSGSASMVLLRNEPALLPLDGAVLSSLAVLGPNAARARIQGGGSATVNPVRTVSPVEGIRAAVGDSVLVRHAPGVVDADEVLALDTELATDPDDATAGLRLRIVGAAGEWLRDEHRLLGRIVWLGDLPAGASGLELSAVVEAPAAGTYVVAVTGHGRFHLRVDGATRFDGQITAETDIEALLRPPRHSVHVELSRGQRVRLDLSHTDLDPEQGTVELGMTRAARPAEQELADAVTLARDCDAAVVVVGTDERVECEGVDRADLGLPTGQDELVRQVAAANPRTVVVVNSGGPVLLPWRADVPAVLLSWFGGQEFGAALADVLLGAAEPAGRLPTTWPASTADVPVLDTTPTDGALEYTEGLHIGYRAWARSQREPAYPFGHGLGYTSWRWDDIEVVEAAARPTAAATVRVRLHNTGSRQGRQVVQVYLARQTSAVERPYRWLAGYAAASADPGEPVDVTVDLPTRSFQHWADGSWHTEPGEFTVLAGASATDLPLRTTVHPTAAP